MFDAVFDRLSAVFVRFEKPEASFRFVRPSPLTPRTAPMGVPLRCTAALGCVAFNSFSCSFEWHR
jgi:hypothetical protein